MINSVLAAVCGHPDAFNTAVAFAFTKKFAGEDNLRMIAERYGQSDAEILIANLGFSALEESAYRADLVKIATYCPIEPFSHLSRAEFLKNPSAVSQMAERYGFNFSPIAKCLGDELLELEQMLRSDLESLIRAADPMVVKEAISILDSNLLKTRPSEIVELAALTGARFEDALRYLPDESFINDPSPYLDLARTLGEHTWGALAGVGEDAPLHYANHSKVTPLIYEIRDLLGDHYQHNLGEILAEIKDPGDLDETRKSILEAIKTGQDGAASILRAINEEALPRETVSRVVKVLRGAAPSFIGAFQSDLIRENIDTLAACAAFSRHSLPQVAKHLPESLLSHDPELLISLFRAFKDTTWGLLARFGSDVFEIPIETSCVAGEIARICHESGGYLFEGIEPEAWESRGLSLARKYQQMAGYLVSLGFTDEDLSLPVFEKNFEEFGIRGFHRYILGGDKSNVPVLVENLKNLNRSSGERKPFALVITAHSDYNDSFGSGGLGHQLSLLTSRYQLLIFEVGSIDELGCAIQRTEKLFTDSVGRLDAAERFIFACHGNEDGLVLGAPPLGISDERAELTVGHKEIIRSFGRLVSPGAIGFLDACSTFMGGDAAENIGNVFAREIPHAEIQGAAIPCGTEGIMFDENFEPVEWLFQLHPSQFVKREAKIGKNPSSSS